MRSFTPGFEKTNTSQGAERLKPSQIANQLIIDPRALSPIYVASLDVFNQAEAAIRQSEHKYRI